MGVKGRIVVQVEPDRIGVVIGKGGSTRKMIEERLNVKLWIDSNTGEVFIIPRQETTASELLKARDVVRALAAGFDPDTAILLAEDAYTLDVIDLKEVARSREDLVRIKGRIIGEEGKARRMIEEMSGARLVIGDRHVAIVGDYEQVRVAREAVEMLIRGRQHRTVYDFLRRMRRELERRRLDLWERMGGF